MGIQTQDLNGDGKQDLILTVGGGLATYLGNGDGTFGPVSGTAALSSNFIGLFAGSGDNFVTVTQMAFADWNGDGTTDFAFADPYSGYIGIGLGDGKGAFASAPLLYSPGAPQVSPLAFYAGAAVDTNGYGVADILGYGVADILGYNGVDGSLVSALAAGKGAFSYKVALPPVPSHRWSVDPTVDDFNRDGKPDFLIEDTFEILGIALGKGDGTVQTPIPIPVVSTHGCGTLAASGDINGDGKADLVVTYRGDVNCRYGYMGGPGSMPSGYFVALGNGDGSFASENIHFYALGSSLQAVALEHYHGLTKPLDLVVSDAPLTSANGASASVMLLAGNGDGTFGSPVTVDSGHAVDSILTTDYNRDGRPDLTLVASVDTAAETPIEGGVFLLPGNGDGTFGNTIQIPGTTNADFGSYADLPGANWEFPWRQHGERRWSRQRCNRVPR
jgi:hypothetical protein